MEFIFVSLTERVPNTGWKPSFTTVSLNLFFDCINLSCSNNWHRQQLYTQQTSFSYRTLQLYPAWCKPSCSYNIRDVWTYTLKAYNPWYEITNTSVPFFCVAAKLSRSEVFRHWDNLSNTRDLSPPITSFLAFSYIYYNS